jgi:hypothetical protein
VEEEEVEEEEEEEEEPWDQQKRTSPAANAHGEGELIDEEIEMYPDDDLDDGELPSLSASAARKSPPIGGRLVNGQLTTAKPLSSPSKAGLKTGTAVTTTNIREQRQFWNQLELGEDDDDADDNDEEDDDQWEEEPDDERAAREKSSRRMSKDIDSKDDYDEYEEVTEERRRYGGGRTVESRESIDDQEPPTFCGQTLTAIGEICGYAESHSSPDRRSYNPKASQLKVGRAKKPEVVEEHTAIEVEFVEPTNRLSPDRKKTYLAALARKAKQDFENSKYTSDAEAEETLSITGSDATEDDVYNKFTAPEKRMFVKLINDGLSTSEATKQILKDRKLNPKKIEPPKAQLVENKPFDRQLLDAQHSEVSPNEPQPPTAKLSDFNPSGAKGEAERLAPAQTPPRSRPFANSSDSDRDTRRDRVARRSRLAFWKKGQNTQRGDPRSDSPGSVTPPHGSLPSTDSDSDGNKPLVPMANHRKALSTPSPVDSLDTPPRDEPEVTGAQSLISELSDDLTHLKVSKPVPNIARKLASPSGLDVTLPVTDESEDGQMFARSGISYYDGVRREQSSLEDPELEEEVRPQRKGRESRIAALKVLSPKSLGFSALKEKESGDQQANDVATMEKLQVPLTPLSRTDVQPVVALPLVTPDAQLTNNDFSDMRSTRLVPMKGTDDITEHDKKNLHDIENELLRPASPRVQMKASKILHKVERELSRIPPVIEPQPLKTEFISDQADKVNAHAHLTKSPIISKSSSFDRAVSEPVKTIPKSEFYEKKKHSEGLQSVPPVSAIQASLVYRLNKAREKHELETDNTPDEDVQSESAPAYERPSEPIVDEVKQQSPTPQMIEDSNISDDRLLDEAIEEFTKSQEVTSRYLLTSQNNPTTSESVFQSSNLPSKVESSASSFVSTLNTGNSQLASEESTMNPELENPDVDIETYLNASQYQDYATSSNNPNDSMSVYTANTGYTGFTGTTNYTSSSRVRRPGAARQRLAKAKQIEAAQKKGGWHESIKAVAMSTNRKWDPVHGWVDYEEPKFDAIDPKPSGKIHIELHKKSLGKDDSGNNKVQSEPSTREPVRVPFPPDWERDRSEMLEPELSGSVHSGQDVTSLSLEKGNAVHTANTVERSSVAGSSISEGTPRGWLESMRAASAALAKDGRVWDPERGWRTIGDTDDGEEEVVPDSVDFDNNVANRSATHRDIEYNIRSEGTQTDDEYVSNDHVNHSTVDDSTQTVDVVEKVIYASSHTRSIVAQVRQELSSGGTSLPVVDNSKESIPDYVDESMVLKRQTGMQTQTDSIDSRKPSSSSFKTVSTTPNALDVSETMPDTEVGVREPRLLAKSFNVGMKDMAVSNSNKRRSSSAALDNKAALPETETGEREPRLLATPFPTKQTSERPAAQSRQRLVNIKDSTDTSSFDTSRNASTSDKYVQLGDTGSIHAFPKPKEQKTISLAAQVAEELRRLEAAGVNTATYISDDDEDDEDDIALTKGLLLNKNGAFPSENDRAISPVVDIVKERVSREDMDLFMHASVEKAGHRRPSKSEQRPSSGDSRRNSRSVIPAITGDASQVVSDSPTRRSTGPVDLDEVFDASSDSDDDAANEATAWDTINYPMLDASRSFDASRSSASYSSLPSKPVPKLKSSQRDTSPIRCKRLQSAPIVTPTSENRGGVEEMKSTHLLDNGNSASNHSQKNSTNYEYTSDEASGTTPPKQESSTTISPSVKNKLQYWETRTGHSETSEITQPSESKNEDIVTTSTSNEWKSYLKNKVNATSQAVVHSAGQEVSQTPRTQAAVQAKQSNAGAITVRSQDNPPADGQHINKLNQERRLRAMYTSTDRLVQANDDSVFAGMTVSPDNGNAQNSGLERSDISPIQADDASDSDEHQPSEVYGSEAYGPSEGERKSFFKRLAECAAPMMPSGPDGVPSSHLAFLRSNGQSGMGASRYIPTTFCARPDNVEEDSDADESVRSHEVEKPSTESINTRQHEKVPRSSSAPRVGGTDHYGRSDTKKTNSVVSEDFGAKTAYLEAIAMKTAVSKPKRSESRRRGRSASSVVSSSSQHSEKWKAFLDRKTNSNMSRTTGSATSDASRAAAERYAAAQVDEMMSRLGSLTSHRRSNQDGKNNSFNASGSMNSSVDLNNSTSYTSMRSDHAAEDLAAARVEAMMAALSTHHNLEEGEI